MKSTQITSGNSTGITIVTFLVFVLGTLAASFVPASHFLKHLVAAEPRYHHLTALRQVGPQLDDQDLLLATTDRFLVPFADRVAGQFNPEANSRPAGYIVFPQVNFDPVQTVAVISEFACILHARGGRDIVWGLVSSYVIVSDQESDRITISIQSHLGSVFVEFRVSDVLYEFVDGFYLRGDALKVTAPNLDGGTEVVFPIPQGVECPDSHGIPQFGNPGPRAA